MEMRALFSEEITKLMRKNTNIVIIDADLARSNGTLALKHIFPDRVFNVGIAEQNMACIGAGMAAYGFIPVISSFAAFATRRIIDQISISICYAGLNVKILGTDPGIAAELNGGTHMPVEDIGSLRSIPNLIIYEPADCIQLKQALPQIIDYKGPVYIRMFRKVLAELFDDNYTFDLFKASMVKPGKDVTIAATGIMTQESAEAAKLLAKDGIDAEIINFHTLKPFDNDALISSVSKTGCVVTAENHNVIGGLRSAVAECLCEHYPVPLRSIGFRDCFGEVGKMPDLKKKYGMTAADIAEKTKEVISLKNG
jgi:transketolase